MANGSRFGSIPLERRRRAVRTYTRIVRWMKFLLPVAAFGLVALIFLQGRERGSAIDLFTPAELARLGAGLRLEQPRFSGVTEGGEPFTVTAEWALPDSAMPEHVEFEKPEGDMTLEDGRKLHVTAEKGFLDRSAETLTLRGDVIIRSSDGYDLRTGTLEVDFGENRATAPGPVRGRSPDGEIDAGSMRVRAAGKKLRHAHIWFENDVRVLFIPERDG